MTIRIAAEREKRILNGQYGDLRERRIGVMLHYDGSGSDDGAIRWFEHPDCRVSYNYGVLDDGNFVEIAPITRRAWHAGVCRPSDPRLVYQDANSAFVGIAAFTNDKVGVTAPQLHTIAFLAWRVFKENHLALDEDWRVVGHDTEAWPRGRKIDPTGPLPDHPILRIDDVRRLLPLVTLL